MGGTGGGWAAGALEAGSGLQHSLSVLYSLLSRCYFCTVFESSRACSGEGEGRAGGRAPEGPGRAGQAGPAHTREGPGRARGERSRRRGAAGAAECRSLREARRAGLSGKRLPPGPGRSRAAAPSDPGELRGNAARFGAGPRGARVAPHSPAGPSGRQRRKCSRPALPGACPSAFPQHATSGTV